MKKVALLFCLISFTRFGFAQIASVNVETPFIDVVGDAFLDVEPDLIYIKVIIDDNEVSKSIDEHETKLVAALENAGIDIDDRVTIKDMNTTVYQYWLKKNKNVTRKEYEILARTPEEVSAIFKAIKEADIYNADIDRMQLSNQLELEHKVEIEAIINAKNKATELALAIGQEIGSAIVILDKKSSEQNGAYNRSSVASHLTGSVRGVGIGLKSMEHFSMELKKIRIEGSVLVRYELK